MGLRLLPAFSAGLLILSLGFSVACSGGDAGDEDAATATPRPTEEPTPDPTQGAIADEVQLTDADDGTTVQIGNGGTLIVALPSNRTTGYSWSVSDASDAQLELQGEPAYVPAGSTTPVVGAGGTEVFTFSAVDTGTASLILEYRRPFEPNAAPEDTFEVTIEIR